MVMKLSLRKSTLDTRTQGGGKTRQVKIRLAVEGTAESHMGLQLALEAIEALDGYLAYPRPLENESGLPLAGTRIVCAVNPEDSFLDSPDSVAVQDVLDERLLTVTVPAREGD
jgi:hypothetical protein